MKWLSGIGCNLEDALIFSFQKFVQLLINYHNHPDKLQSNITQHKGEVSVFYESLDMRVGGVIIDDQSMMYT